MTKMKPTEPVASIPLPSADLINFRFDQLERAQKELRNENKNNFDALGEKLDYMGQTFISRHEFNEVRDAKDREHVELWDAIRLIRSNMKWWATWIVAALGVAVGVADVIVKLSKHG